MTQKLTIYFFSMGSFNRFLRLNLEPISNLSFDFNSMLNVLFTLDAKLNKDYHFTSTELSLTTVYSNQSILKEH
jgi:hypothetical protein